MLFDRLRKRNVQYLEISDIRDEIEKYGLIEPSAHDIFRSAETAVFGRMTFEEFYNFAQQRDEFMRHHFNEMDLSSSGSINRHELKRALKKAGMAPTDDQIRNIIALVDRPSGNGTYQHNLLTCSHLIFGIVVGKSGDNGFEAWSDQ